MLLRALRDFNLGKLTADDTGIFMGLLNDLFPKTLDAVPRAVNPSFESHVCFDLWLREISSQPSGSVTQFPADKSIFAGHSQIKMAEIGSLTGPAMSCR